MMQCTLFLSAGWARLPLRKVGCGFGYVEWNRKQHGKSWSRMAVPLLMAKLVESKDIWSQLEI